MRRPSGPILLVLSILAGACTGAGSSSSPTTAGAGSSATGALSVHALSTRPEYVTGGDVLVGIDVAEAGDEGGLGEVTVTVGDRDVTASFAPDDGRLVGLVDGLPVGDAVISVTRGDDVAELAVTNHPTTGPLFSGPHQEPFVCTTQAAGLGPATDADCSAPVRTDTVDLGGVATTVERGVIGRSIYTIAVPREGWNERLVYRFGGGCGTSYSQGASMVSAEDPDLLAKGYAVATSSLNTFQTACNSVLSAEVALMVKEHVAETYGLPRFTIGEGGSGGAIQQLQIVQNYPGIIDAVSATVPFPDAASIAPGVTDCGLLVHYYSTPSGSGLTDEQRTAVNGHRTKGTCELWTTSFVPTVDPTVGCAAGLPAEQRFDPVENPDGVRCTFQDSNVNVYGRDPATGYARRPLDNVGVQYGLQALVDGVISIDQFLDLNERIGGYDIDGRIAAERSSADEEALRTVYAKGQSLVAGDTVASVPIILTNVYTDDMGDIHDRQRIFAIRERLTSSDGTPDPNLVLWTLPGRGGLTETLLGAVSQVSQAVVVLDEWLTAAAADPDLADRPDPADRGAALARNKPTSAVDTCVTPDGASVTGDTAYDEDNACTAAYPVASDPRRVAGAPLRNDIGKCRLRPVDQGDYPVPLTDAQLERLEQVFPDGVCDWTQPGVGQVPLEGTWLRY